MKKIWQLGSYYAAPEPEQGCPCREEEVSASGIRGLRMCLLPLELALDGWEPIEVDETGGTHFTRVFIRRQIEVEEPVAAIEQVRSLEYAPCELEPAE